MSRVEQVGAAYGFVLPRGSTLFIAARGFASISAALAVMVSTVLASLAGYAMGYGLTDVPIPAGPGLAIGWAVLGGLVALLKAALAIELAASSLTNRAVVGACGVWLTLLVFNWFLISIVGAVYFTGLHVTYEVVGFSMAVLLIEVVSGYLPGFMYMTKSASGSPVASSPRGKEDVPPKLMDDAPATVTPLIFDNFPDLFAYVHQFDCTRLPGLREDPDGGLVASQAVFARLFGRSRSTINTRMWKEHDLGRLIVTPGSRETKIALPRTANVRASSARSAE